MHDASATRADARGPPQHHMTAGHQPPQQPLYTSEVPAGVEPGQQFRVPIGQKWVEEQSRRMHVSDSNMFPKFRLKFKLFLLLVYS